MSRHYAIRIVSFILYELSNI